ncbi:hypothetical protein [Pseudorhodoferax sp.]|uniref:hypothetical protein n=1 Tax=Pseudorhodoferax sp. TaxID=1993553 RepID=UPI0039E2F819
MRLPRPLARFEEHRLALCLCAALGSACAVAQARAQDVLAQAPVGAPVAHHVRDGALQRVDEAFGRADTDGDGRLSREEAQRLPAVAERFDEIDANHDRVLSREEFHRGVSL